MTVPTTRDFSVKFGRDPAMGLESQKAFPFIYTFVNHSDDTWAPVPLNTTESMAHIGPLIPAGATRQISVRLDPDYNFKLLNIKYTAYTGDVLTGRYSWYESASLQTHLTDGKNPDDELIGIPLIHYIRVSLFFQGSGSYTLYGGQNTDPVIPAAAVNGRIPIPLETLQGYDYGFQAARTPYLLPRQGILTFDVTNSHPGFGIYVGAAIYGMKVRV